MGFDTDIARIGKAITNKEMLLVVGDCYIEYVGRAASKLAKGRRLIMVKSDGCFIVHQKDKMPPVNYMTAGTTISVKASERKGEEVLLMTGTKAKPKESLKVFFYEIDFVKSFDLIDNEQSKVYGLERELSSLLMQDLEHIEPGLKPLKQEGHTRKGSIDILAEDSKGRAVIVEVKRRNATMDAVMQLQRYVKQLEKMKGREVRGILLAPGINKSAQELLAEAGLEYKRLDYVVGNPCSKITGLEGKQQKLF